MLPFVALIALGRAFTRAPLRRPCLRRSTACDLPSPVVVQLFATVPPSNDVKDSAIANIFSAVTGEPVGTETLQQLALLKAVEFTFEISYADWFGLQDEPDHDPTKCRKNGVPDPGCCTGPHQFAGCDDGYVFLAALGSGERCDGLATTFLAQGDLALCRFGQCSPTRCIPASGGGIYEELSFALQGKLVSADLPPCDADASSGASSDECNAVCQYLHRALGKSGLMLLNGRVLVGLGDRDSNGASQSIEVVGSLEGASVSMGTSPNIVLTDMGFVLGVQRTRSNDGRGLSRFSGGRNTAAEIDAAGSDGLLPFRIFGAILISAMAEVSREQGFVFSGGLGVEWVGTSITDATFFLQLDSPFFEAFGSSTTHLLEFNIDLGLGDRFPFISALSATGQLCLGSRAQCEQCYASDGAACDSVLLTKVEADISPVSPVNLGCSPRPQDVLAPAAETSWCDEPPLQIAERIRSPRRPKDWDSPACTYSPNTATECTLTYALDEGLRDTVDALLSGRMQGPKHCNEICADLGGVCIASGDDARDCPDPNARQSTCSRRRFTQSCRCRRQAPPLRPPKDGALKGSASFEATSSEVKDCLATERCV